MRKILIALVATASAVAFTSSAFAGPISPTNIDFSCADGSGTGSAGALCNGSSPKSPAPVNFSSWTQGAFTIASSSMPNGGKSYYNPNQGDVPPGLTLGGVAGNYTLNVTGGDFFFNSLNLGAYTGHPFDYTITGFLNGTQEFQLTGEICMSGCASGAQAAYTLINGNKDNINDLKITLDPLSSGSYAYLDNVNLTATPEPSTLLLMGTGILALAFFARRRAKGSSAQPNGIA